MIGMRNSVRIDKASSVVFVCFFLVVLLSPLVGGLSGMGKAAKDNRPLAQMPGKPEDLDQLLEWPRKVDRYASDHFGFRQNLVEQDTALHLAFSEAGRDSAVVAGRSGRLFFSDGDVPLRVLLGNCGAWWDRDMLDSFGRDVTRGLQIMSARSPEMKLLVVPTSSALYQGELPEWIAKACAGRALLVDQVAESLSKPLAEKMSYPIQLGKSLPEESSLIPKKNFHWDGKGIYVFMGRYAEVELGLSSVTQPDWNRVRKPSDLSRFVPGGALANDIEEPDWRSSGLSVCSGASPCLNDYPLDSGVLPAETLRLRRSGPGVRMVLFSDSFGAGAAFGLLGYANDIVVVNMNNLANQAADERRALTKKLLREWPADRRLMLIQDGNFTRLGTFADALWN